MPNLKGTLRVNSIQSIGKFNVARVKKLLSRVLVSVDLSPPEPHTQRASGYESVAIVRFEADATSYREVSQVLDREFALVSDYDIPMKSVIPLRKQNNPQISMISASHLQPCDHEDCQTAAPCTGCGRNNARGFYDVPKKERNLDSGSVYGIGRIAMSLVVLLMTFSCTTAPKIERVKPVHPHELLPDYRYRGEWSQDPPFNEEFELEVE
jgi:hypothetical protein